MNLRKEIVAFRRQVVVGTPKSDYLPEAPLQVSEIRDAEFDADKSWETRDERYSIGSEIEWAHNSGGQGAAELANYYRKVIGQHPFEIELTIERERRGKEVAEKEKLAREEQEAIVAKAIEEAILEKKRREWNERKLADEKARQTEEQERASRAMAAKQRRELTQTRFKQMATKTAEARKRESNSSAITTWSRVIGSKCGQEVGGGRIDIANGRLNTKFPTQRTVAPSVCSLASGLTTSRRPARDDVAQRSKSSAFSTPLPTGERQEQSSVQSVTLTPQELHDVAGRLALEKLEKLHRQYAAENEIQSSSRRVFEEMAQAPSPAQKEFPQRTQHYGGERPLKSRTWSKNEGGQVSDKGKQLPRVRMVNGRWIEESTGEVLDINEARVPGNNDTDTLPSYQIDRYSDPSTQQRAAGSVNRSEGSSPYGQLKPTLSLAERELYGRQTNQ
jgi:hypothetical protein